MANELQKPEKIIDEAIDGARAGIGRIESKFLDQLVEYLLKFDVIDNGKLSNTKANNKKIRDFRRNVERFLLRAGYNDFVDDFLVNFDELDIAQRDAHKSLNSINVKSSLVNPYKAQAIRNTTADLRGAGFSQEVTNILQNELFSAVKKGGSLRDLIKSVENQLTKTKVGGNGLITRNTLTATRDALGQYEGQVNEAIRIAFELDAYLYIGSLIRDSRSQCRRWVNFLKNGKKGLILFSQLSAEIRWALNNGSGMIANTTRDTFAQFRGGYGCRHTAYPTRSSDQT